MAAVKAADFRPDPDRYLAAFNEAISCGRCDARADVEWYRRHGRRIRRMADMAGVDRRDGVAGFAVLSQRTRLSQNYARYADWLAGRSLSGLRGQLDRLEQIRSGDRAAAMVFPAGLKVHRFDMNLWHYAADDGLSTHDVWTIRPFYGGDSLSVPQYRAAESALAAAAAVAGIKAKSMQAPIWTHARSCGADWRNWNV